MTYPTVPRTLVSIYMAAESMMVRFIWLAPYLLSSHVQLFATPWTAALQASLYFTVSQSLLRLMYIESVMPANHLILFSCLQSFPASGSFPMSQFFASGKTIAPTIRNFVSKVTSLLSNTLSRFVIASLPRSNCLLISWLQSPCAGILEPKKRNLSLLPPFPILFAMKGWDRMP